MEATAETAPETGVHPERAPGSLRQPVVGLRVFATCNQSGKRYANLRQRQGGRRSLLLGSLKSTESNKQDLGRAITRETPGV